MRPSTEYFVEKNDRFRLTYADSIGPSSPLSSRRIPGTSSTRGERLAHDQPRGAVQVAHPRLHGPARGREVGQAHAILERAAADLGGLHRFGVGVDVELDVARPVLTHLHRDRGVDRARAEEERERDEPTSEQ